MMSLEIDRGPEIIYRRSGGGRGVRVKGVKGVKGVGGRLGFVQNTIYLILPKGSVIFLAPTSPLLAKTDRPSVPPLKPHVIPLRSFAPPSSSKVMILIGP